MKRINWRLTFFTFVILITLAAFCSSCVQFEYQDATVHLKYNSLGKDIEWGDLKSESNKIKAIGAGGYLKTEKGEGE
jgi:hypothetical protein